MWGPVAFATVLALAAELPAQGWTSCAPPASPPGRSHHALAHDLVRGVTVLFGGLSGWRLGDTWEWNGANWTLRTFAASPPARSDHALAYALVSGSVVLFG